MAQTELAAGTLTTQRLELRPWRRDDAEAALSIFGEEEVARWLSPAIDPITDPNEMRALIDEWADADADDEPPVGHWAVTRRSDGELLGAVTLRRMPPDREDLELAWQFSPAHWGHGYATEAAHAVARWGFDRSGHEIFAVARPTNERAIKLAQRLGMSWVGETEKYYDLKLQVFRVRPPELVAPTILPAQR